MSRKTWSTFLVITFVLVSFSTASARHWYHGYSHHHYHHGHHYSYDHYGSDDLWISLGVGLFTGLLFGALFSQPRHEPQVVYYQPQPQPVKFHTYPNQIPYESPVMLTDSVEIDTVLRRVVSTPPLLNVRILPGNENRVIEQLQNGTVLDVLGAAPEWLYIKTPEGNYGWVKDKFTELISQPVG